MFADSIDITQQLALFTKEHTTGTRWTQDPISKSFLNRSRLLRQTRTLGRRPTKTQDRLLRLRLPEFIVVLPRKTHTLQTHQALPKRTHSKRLIEHRGILGIHLTAIANHIESAAPDASGAADSMWLAMAVR